MASTVLFVVMAIFAAILLFVASLTASIGATDAFGSSFYNTDARVRSAHQSLTIAAALGWSALVVLIVILIVAAVAGGFSAVEISDALLEKSNPTKGDLLQAYRGEKELSAGHTTQIIVLIILVIIAIIAFVVGILAAIAAVQLGGMIQQDDKSRSAYIYSIVATVAGIGGIGIMIVAVIAYIGIRSARAEQLAKLEAFEKRVEAQLGITPSQLTVMSVSTPIQTQTPIHIVGTTGQQVTTPIQTQAPVISATATPIHIVGTTGQQVTTPVTHVKK